MNETDQIKKRKRIETAVKAIGLIVGGFIVAPYVFIAVQGLVGLAIAAVAALTIIYTTPAVASALANWRLKLLKAEAMKNPVETLQNDYIKRQESLADFRKAIKSFMTEVQTFADKLVEFTQQYPADAEKFKSQLDKMKKLLRLRERKYTQAQENLDAYQLEIQKAGAIWEMGCAAARMNEAAGMTDEDFFAKIQVETALDSVQKKLNEAFADLEISLLDEDKETAKKIYAEKQNQLTEGHPNVIDAIVVKENNREKVTV